MVRIGVILLVVAGFLGVFAWKEGTLAAQSSAAPEEIGLKNLIARGPNGNANVVVTDYIMCKNFTYQYQKNNPNSWTEIWIPIVPLDSVDLKKLKEPPSPANVQALFYSKRVHGQGDLNRLDVPRTQGLVTNRITSLESKIRDMLRQTYPGTNFDKCLIIEEGRAPTSWQLVILAGGGAGVAALAGLVLLVLGFVGKKR